MKKGYYVTTKAQTNGDHEVHEEDCSWRSALHSKYLGHFDSCADAVKEAKKTYRTADGCAYCSKPCHTR